MRQSEVNEDLVLALGFVDALGTLERVLVAEVGLDFFSEVIKEQMFQQFTLKFELFFAELTNEHGDFAVPRAIALQ